VKVFAFATPLLQDIIATRIVQRQMEYLVELKKKAIVRNRWYRLWDGFVEMRKSRAVLEQHGFSVTLNIGLPCDEICEALGHVPGVHKDEVFEKLKREHGASVFEEDEAMTRLDAVFENGLGESGASAVSGLPQQPQRAGSIIDFFTPHEVQTVKAKVKANFEKSASGQLSVAEGDQVDVLEHREKDTWWKVEDQFGESGLVPKYYLKVIEKQMNKGRKGNLSPTKAIAIKRHMAKLDVIEAAAKSDGNRAQQRIEELQTKSMTEQQELKERIFSLERTFSELTEGKTSPARNRSSIADARNKSSIQSGSIEEMGGEMGGEYFSPKSPLNTTFNFDDSSGGSTPALSQSKQIQLPESALDRMAKLQCNHWSAEEVLAWAASNDLRFDMALLRVQCSIPIK
jgi:hypothetical protein